MVISPGRTCASKIPLTSGILFPEPSTLASPINTRLFSITERAEREASNEGCHLNFFSCSQRRYIFRSKLQTSYRQTTSFVEADNSILALYSLRGRWSSFPSIFLGYTQGTPEKRFLMRTQRVHGSRTSTNYIGVAVGVLYISIVDSMKPSISTTKVKNMKYFYPTSCLGPFQRQTVDHACIFNPIFGEVPISRRLAPSQRPISLDTPCLPRGDLRDS